MVYAFFSTELTVEDYAYRKSSDGGASWGSRVTIATNASDEWSAGSVWFDKWTAGDSGTLIHIAYFSEIDPGVRYDQLDTADDSLTGQVAVAAVTAGTVQDTDSICHITKARGGNLYIAYSITATVHDMSRSTDGGANWTSRADPWEGDVDDAVNSVLLPANAADNQDIWLVHGDQSANAVTVKTYDNSGDSWSETAIGSPPTIVFGTASLRQVAAAIRHSDGHAIIAINTHIDNAAGDLLVYDWDGSSFTAKTNIITDKDDWAIPAVCIDQNTDDIYVGWIGNPAGTDTWTATVSIFYDVSTDGGSTWAGATQYSEGAADDYRCLFTSHSSPGAADGLFILSWFDDDDNDLWTNAVNAVVLAAGGAASTIATQLVKIAFAATAAQVHESSVATQLAKVQALLNAVMIPDAAVATTLAKVSASLTVAEEEQSTIATTLVKVAAELQASQVYETQVTTVLAKVNALLDAVMVPDGAIATQLVKVNASLTAEQVYALTIATALLRVVAALEASQVYDTQVGVLLAHVTTLLDAVMTPDAAIAAELANVTAELHAEHGELQSTIATTLARVQAALLAEQPFDTSIATQLVAIATALDASQIDEAVIAASLVPIRAELQASHLDAQIAATLIKIAFAATAGQQYDVQIATLLAAVAFSGTANVGAVVLARIIQLYGLDRIAAYLTGIDRSMLRSAGLDPKRRADSRDVSALRSQGFDRERQRTRGEE